MTPTKEEIKKWLDENGYSYEWLAAKCLVKYGTVRNWMAKKPIPSAKLELIRKEMSKQREDSDKKASSFPILNGVAAVAVPLSEEDLKTISKAAQISGQTIEEFIRDAAIEDADEHRKSTK